MKKPNRLPASTPVIAAVENKGYQFPEWICREFNMTDSCIAGR